MSLESVRSWLCEHAPDLPLIETEASTATVLEAAAALGVEPGQIAKTLALRIDDRIVLLVTRGEGRVRLLDGHDGSGQTTHDVAEGALVALNAAEAIELEAVSDELHAVSVMNPPLYGVEQAHATTGGPVTRYRRLPRRKRAPGARSAR